jgi:transcriptional regulator with XRE-family HTH domain
MSDFTDRIDSRRKELDLSLADVVSLLQLHGVDVAYQTVASWFNGERGDRWKPSELLILLGLLQTDLAAMAGNGLSELPDLSSPIYNATSRELASLTELQQVALLSLIKSFRA